MSGWIKALGAALLSAGFSALIVLTCQTPSQAALTGVTFSNIYSFGANSSATGENPSQSVTFGNGGNLYGVTYAGGANYTGTVFEDALSAGTVTALHTFAALGSNGTNADGETPSGPLAEDASQNLYGVTQSGGPSGFGTLYEVSSSGVFNVLYTFPYAAATGGNPAGTLVVGSDGSIFGTATTGGNNGEGVVYRFNPSTGLYSVLHSFASAGSGSANADGLLPSGLVVGTDGNLYGSCSSGGANGSGTLFEITPGGTFTLLYTFTAVVKTNGNSSNIDGQSPNSNLAFDGSGNLYGTAQRGGANNTGTVFELSAAGGFTTLHSFSSTSNNENSDGAQPYAGLIYASDANLYGTTLYGGSNGHGTIFQINPNTTFNSVHTFNGGTNSGNSDGANPSAILTIGPDGNLYGTADKGGSNNKGVLFKVSLGAPLTAPTPPTLNITVPTRFDFNQDGHADLIWYNTGSGDLSIWDMDDQTVLQYGGTFTQLAPSSGWQPVAAPDVNDDGVPDLIWWNSQTGELSAWTLAAGSPPSVTSFGSDFGQIADTTWKPVAAADVTGTTWELIFQNTGSGAISVWQMNGTSVTSYGGVLGSVGSGTGWQVVGAPDIDGDGHSDLLFWNSQTGEVAWWGCNLANQQVLSYNSDFAQVQDTSWHLVGSEDTNGDGHPDLIWWNATSGIESRWLLDGTTVTDYGASTTQVSDTTWQPTAIR